VLLGRYRQSQPVENLCKFLFPAHGEFQMRDSKDEDEPEHFSEPPHAGQSDGTRDCVSDQCTRSAFRRRWLVDRNHIMLGAIATISVQ